MDGRIPVRSSFIRSVRKSAARDSTTSGDRPEGVDILGVVLSIDRLSEHAVCEAKSSPLVRDTMPGWSRTPIEVLLTVPLGRALAIPGVKKKKNKNKKKENTKRE